MKKKVNNSSKKRNKLDKEKNKIENVGSFDTNISTIIYVVIGVACVFVSFYLLTLFVLNKDTDTTNNDEEVSISLDSTIVGRSLSMPEDYYYVLYYDTSDETVMETYSSVVNDYMYSTDENHVKLYTVDMSDALNKKYIAEESKPMPEKASDIAIKGTTLMIIDNGKVVEYVEDQNRIEELLK